MTNTNQTGSESVHSDKNKTDKVFKVSRRNLLQAGLGLGASGLLLGFRPSAMLAKPSAAAAAAAAADSGVVFAPNVFVEIEESGKIRLIVHRTEMGQGVRTSLPMMLAEELEVDLDQVELKQALGDPKFGNQNTDGSTSIRLNGNRCVRLVPRPARCWSMRPQRSGESQRISVAPKVARSLGPKKRSPMAS